MRTNASDTKLVVWPKEATGFSSIFSAVFAGIFTGNVFELFDVFVVASRRTFPVPGSGDWVEELLDIGG